MLAVIFLEQFRFVVQRHPRNAMQCDASTLKQ